MTREQLDLLTTLQAHEFTAFDLVLYLDTHPTDQRALADYMGVNRETKRLQQIYSNSYSPLRAEDESAVANYWRWAEEPWPWDLEY